MVVFVIGELTDEQILRTGSLCFDVFIEFFPYLNFLLNFLFVQRLNQFSKANRTIRLSGTKIMLTSDIMS